MKNVGFNVEDNKSDIQALLLQGYKTLDRSRYLALRFDDQASIQKFLQQTVPILTAGDKRSADEVLCMGISSKGLRLIGLDQLKPGVAEFAFPSSYDTFPPEFIGDLGSKRARRVIGESDGNWNWGTNDNDTADLFIIQLTKSASDNKHSVVDQAIADTGCTLLLDQCDISDNEKGPFGFLDGISNPELTPRKNKPGYSQQAVAPGEFVFGYPNAVGSLALSPSVPLDCTGADTLPELDDDFGRRRDLGRNGSFLVVQQLAADVEKFRALPETTGHKLVGRKPCGEPLTPIGGLPTAPRADINAFNFNTQDLHGYHCPIGAHIRRVNPRDTRATGNESSTLNVHQHRILRRGRAYKNDSSRGLLFLCFNTQINRQFEFIQQNWIQNTRFLDMRDESDPLLGHHREFTLQDHPVGKRLSLDTLVTMLGGGYFFFPGIRAAKFLAAWSPPED
jgi:Dyp-type peroxidase family